MPPLVSIKTNVRRSAVLLALAAYASRLADASAEPNEPVASASLELDANSSCATVAELIERVRARSPRVRFVVDGSGLGIRVQIAQTASGTVAGEVTLANPGTAPSTRRVPARSCSEAMDAVALIIAVTLDPTAIEHGATPSAENSAAPSIKPTSKSTIDGATPPAPQRSVSNPSAEASTQIEINSSARRARATFQGQFAAEGIVGVAPGIMPALALFATLGVERQSVWSPALALGVRHAWRTDVQAPGGSASFAFDAVTLDLCPVRFRRGVIEVRPCGSALVGRLSVQGSETLNPAPESLRPFWALGGAAIVTANLFGPLQASGRFAIGANLVRDSYEFNPTTFHRVSPLSVAASVGIGVGWR